MAKVMYAQLYESYCVIYQQPDTKRNTIEHGFPTQAEAQKFANEKEEEAAHPLLWYAKQ